MILEHRMTWLWWGHRGFRWGGGNCNITEINVIAFILPWATLSCFGKGFLNGDCLLKDCFIFVLAFGKTILFFQIVDWCFVHQLWMQILPWFASLSIIWHSFCCHVAVQECQTRLSKEHMESYQLALCQWSLWERIRVKYMRKMGFERKALWFVWLVE